MKKYTSKPRRQSIGSTVERMMRENCFLWSHKVKFSVLHDLVVFKLGVICDIVSSVIEVRVNKFTISCESLTTTSLKGEVRNNWSSLANRCLLSLTSCLVGVFWFSLLLILWRHHRALSKLESQTRLKHASELQMIVVRHS